ncbi:uncharacterized protein TNCV_3372011 [Trichonephila clavipes]|nr:uncharacterized protein TNCV_3372011 [Trichonephila clavipes]
MVRREPEEEKGERGYRVTCVILVKKLDNCLRLRLVNLPNFRLGDLLPRPENIISGRISCSGFLDRANTNSSLPLSGNGKDLDMENLPTDMELEQASSQRTYTRTPSPQPQLSPCEQLKCNKAQLAKMEAFRKCKQVCVDTLRQMPDHYPDEPVYVRALTELQDIEEIIAIVVSDIDSYEPCIIPGDPLHKKTPTSSPTKLTQTTP